MNKRKIIIYSPASGAIKKVNKNGRDSWEKLEASPTIPRIKTEEQEDPPKIFEEGDQVLLEVWPGMTQRDILRAWQKVRTLFGNKPGHLENYPAYLRGKKYWEERYIDGQNLITLNEIPDKLKKLTWENLAEKEGITIEAIKKSIKIFNDNLPQYLKDKVDLVAEIEKRASSR